MCKNLDRSPLLSAEFARLNGVGAEYLGEFELRGVAEKQPAYGLIAARAARLAGSPALAQSPSMN
jgi:hypothetical protein